MTAVPFIDLFAGPGGLSEGFSRFASFTGSNQRFESLLAIEKDSVAVETLRLRSFFRSFQEGEVPEDYYDVLRGKRSVSSLALHSSWKDAEKHVWQATLGEIEEAALHHRIAALLDGRRDWVLLGGPPCQAYSLVGRSRMTGVGTTGQANDQEVEELRELKRSKFANDRRHVLYREYLRIVAVHEPAIFVMENVKGILSAKLPTAKDEDAGYVFEQIRRDLSDPLAALESDFDTSLLTALKRSQAPRYHLYSFVIGQDRSDDELRDSEFVIRAEQYGIPQKRHRVILLGIREDVCARPTALSRAQLQTVRDAIGEFPRLRSGLSKEDDDWGSWIGAINREIESLNGINFGVEGVVETIDAFLSSNQGPLGRGSSFMPAQLATPNSDIGRWYYDERIGGIVQHETRSHMRSDLVRYLFAAAAAESVRKSPKLEEWPSELLPNHKNVSHDKDTSVVMATGFSDRFKVQIWDEPSSTITSHIAKDGHYFIHPDPYQCRSLTVREAARLQTFPDNYYFCGNRTQQYHQVGNAVPPYLACQIAGVVAKLMKDSGLAPECDG